MTAAQKPRLDWVDIAKGLSIILVVMMHSTYGVGNDTGETGFMHYVLAFATPFRMPEFFLISGLFLGAVIARPWRHFADRRIVHYLYFYVLWAVIIILFKHLMIDRDPSGTLATLGTAVYDPYSVLWFIYALAVFGLIAKLLWQFKVPHWAALAAAAAVSIAPVETPVAILNYTAHYFVFFYLGYAGAPGIMRFAEEIGKRPAIALAGLVFWAIANAALVFAPGHVFAPGFVTIGVADVPGATFALAVAGALAVCTTAVLLAKTPRFAWLRWVGANSIVIYLSFVIPMGVFRTILLRVMPNIDAGIASLAVLFVAVASPLVLYWIIGRTGFGKFLFERPAWAHIPGAPGSRWGTPARPQPAQ
ncbi:acyltransferase family protein [Pelagibacterium xiamenense]|uniref:acyltransferase family protein n=1 Tax=Pelagibacterium xiamenense TaxID=2901140 RepID=UPI001E2BDC8E|nr:acyltransferase family protein [Pelagibacterium xiamenense]MCD7059962.1 acyltransferase family protein [Pelagibacterium xiamenense]